MYSDVAESKFEYQSKQIFDRMVSDYREEMEDAENSRTFSDWLWDNREELGKHFFEVLDEWVGIDEFTEEYNV